MSLLAEFDPQYRNVVNHQDYLDDLETILYVLIWIVLVYDGPGEARRFVHNPSEAH